MYLVELLRTLLDLQKYMLMKVTILKIWSALSAHTFLAYQAFRTICVQKLFHFIWMLANWQNQIFEMVPISAHILV